MTDRISKLPERMQEKIHESDTGCWVWQGAGQGTGYGVTWFEGKNHLTHRLFYEMFIGPIPDGLDIDHLCRVRSCCNPDHLEPTTRQENLRRGINANTAKTACPKGHEYNDENTRMHKGRRYCRACDKERSKRRYAERYGKVRRVR